MSGQSLRSLMTSALGLRVIVAAVNYGLFWILSRQLPTELLGGYSLLMNVFLLVQTLPLLGLHIPLMRRAATEPERLGDEISNALAFALPVAGILAAVVAGVGAWTYPENLTLPFVLVAVSIFATAWTMVAEAALLGMERMADIALVQCVEVVSRAALALVALTFGYGLTGIFAILLGLRVLAALRYLRLGGLPRPQMGQFRAALLKRNLSEVPVFMGIVVLAAFSTRLDMIVLSRMRSLHDVAVYASASRLYDAALMLPTVAATVMIPMLARLFTSDPARFRELLSMALRGSLAGGMLVALAVAALAQPVVSLLYRDDLGDAAVVLRWLIFGAVFMTADQVLSSTMLAAKAQKEDMKALARALLVLVVGLLAFTHAFGAYGTAMAVALAQCFRVGLRVHWAASAMEVPQLWREWARQMAAGGAGALALVAALPIGSMAALAAGWLGWLIAARWSGILGEDWWRVLPGQLRRLMGRSPD